MVEHATSHDCVFIASLREDVTVTDRGLLLDNWDVTKIDNRVVQVRKNGVFNISQPSRCSVYLHCRAEKRTLEDVTFTIFSNTQGKQVSSEVVRLPKGESISILIHHTVSRSETLTVRIFGVDLDFVVEKLSRVEVTETHRWEAPELVVGNQLYPWKDQTINLANDIEKYQCIYITGMCGNDFLLKTIYPVALNAVRRGKWKVDNDNQMLLSFSGDGHKKLKVESEKFSVFSLYGVRC